MTHKKLKSIEQIDYKEFKRSENISLIKIPNYAPNVTREAYDKLKHSPRLLDYYYGEEEELLFGSLEKWLEFLKDWRYASKLHNKKKNRCIILVGVVFTHQQHPTDA